MNPFFGLRPATLCVIAHVVAAVPYPFNAAYDGFTPLAPRKPTIQSELGLLLSPQATLYFPGSEGYSNATARWNQYGEPKIQVVVEVGTEKDVQTTIIYANQKNIPFLAVNRGHGSTETLAKLENGIEIHVRSLDKIEVLPSGDVASMGGGVYNDQVIQTLYDHRKQSSSGSCGCVGLLGAGLGGGHGRLESWYGLILDNIIDARVVLGDGSIVNVSATSHPDLWWGLRGAGHNFGIVTEFNYKIYDLLPTPNGTWYYDTFIFTQEKLEPLFEQVNKMMNNGTQPKQLGNFLVYSWVPELDATAPVIIFTIHYSGTQEQEAPFSEPYHELGAISFQNGTVPYPQLASAVGTGSDSQLCAFGYKRLQFPAYLQTYNVTTQRQIYNLFNEMTTRYPVLNKTVAVLEGYSVEAVQAVPEESTAFPHRSDNILVVLQVVYDPNTKSSVDDEAIAWGKKSRELWIEGSGRDEYHVYTNYAFGDESLESIYGYEPWRLQKLRDLKIKYDPNGRFNWYNPIA